MMFNTRKFHSLTRVAARVAIAAALTLAVSGSRVSAQTITFTFSGIGSGVYGGNSFSETPFNIALAADISTLTDVEPNITRYNNTTGSINIAGFVTASFLAPLYVFHNNNGPIVGFGTTTNFDLINIRSALLADYDMISAFGPVAGIPPYANGQFSNVATTQGTLTFRSLSQYQVEATVVGQVVPEPASVAFVAMGMAGIGLVYRRRRV